MPKSLYLKGQTFKKAGAYENDCPFCRTHNALLVKDFTADGSVLECRDCHRLFESIKGASEITHLKVVS